MRIALDAAGGAVPLLEGALRACELGHELVLTGPEAVLRGAMESCPGGEEAKKRVSFLDTEIAIAADEDAEAACRTKGQASVMLAAALAGQAKADAFVSAGPARAAVAAALWHVKRVKGVLKPALAATFRTRRGLSLLLDAGADVECKPWHLLQFALMGTILAKRLHQVPEPTVGLLSSRAGEGKGTALIQETLPLLKYSKLRFEGLITPRALMDKAPDVLVCDGFLGSLLLDLMEALSAASFEMLESAFRGGALARLGGLLAGESLSRTREESPPAGGAMAILGVNGSAVACRSSDADSVFQGIRLAADLAGSGVKDDIREKAEDVRSSLEFVKAVE